MRQKVTLLASKGDTILDLEAQAKRAEPEPCSLSLSYPWTLWSLSFGHRVYPDLELAGLLACWLFSLLEGFCAILQSDQLPLSSPGPSLAALRLQEETRILPAIATTLAGPVGRAALILIWPALDPAVQILMD